MIVEALISAWILTWFNLDKMLIEVFQPMVDFELTSSHYYVAFILLGLIGYLFKKEKVKVEITVKEEE